MLGTLASSKMICRARPDMVEALSWQELSEVATAYASLRLYSQSLFGALEGTKNRAGSGCAHPPRYIPNLFATSLFASIPPQLIFILFWLIACLFSPATVLDSFGLEDFPGGRNFKYIPHELGVLPEMFCLDLLIF